MKKDNSKIIGKLIVYSCFVIVLSISIFFSSWFEVLLMLKPDFDKVSGDSFQVHFLDVGDGDADILGHRKIIEDQGYKVLDVQ